MLHKARNFTIVCIIIGIGFGVIVFLVLLRTDKMQESEGLSTNPAATAEYASFPKIDSANFSATQKRILLILQQEYSKHPKDFDANVQKYTQNNNESWCADFASWIMYTAGTPYTNPNSNSWRIPGVLTLQKYYQDYDAYKEVGSYTPRFGDVAFYIGETPDGGSEQHVAIVLASDGKTVTTIGGNETSSGIVQIREDALKEDEKGLIGFGLLTLDY